MTKDVGKSVPKVSDWIEHKVSWAALSFRDTLRLEKVRYYQSPSSPPDENIHNLILPVVG